jgi:hypothetical protein
MITRVCWTTRCATNQSFLVVGLFDYTAPKKQYPMRHLPQTAEKASLALEVKKMDKANKQSAQQRGKTPFSHKRLSVF